MKLVRPAALALLAVLPPLAAQDHAAAAPPTAAARPRLVVICSVDQLARWVFDAALPHFAADGGFRRLLDGGVAFPNCAYRHACTETGPGHATIGTGVDARVHGIAKNEWWDTQQRATVYCASDPAAAALPPFPLGKGHGPGRLLVPTLGDLLKQHDAASKVVSISHKDRSAILMAGARADAVLWFENGAGTFVTSAIWGKEPPQWLLDFAATRPADRFFGWTWERCGDDAAYAGLDDDRKFEMAHSSSGKRTLPVTIVGGRLDEPAAPFYLEAFLSPIADEVVLEGALAALRASGLGQDDTPDLFCVSFSATDTVGHFFCPDGVEARDTLLRVDRLLARLLQALDERVGSGRYAFVLTADHGVGLPPEVAKSKGLGGGRAMLHTHARNAAEQALRAHFGRGGAAAGDAAAPPAPFVLYAGEFMLALDRARIVALRPDADPAATFADACDVVVAALANVNGIASAYAVAELLAHGPGDDPIRRAIWFSLCPGRSGDVAFVVAPYWLEAGLPASHGTPYAYDREVPLLALGPGLRAGDRPVAAVTPGLCAVLAAHWLGIEAPAQSDPLPEGLFVR